MKTSVQRQICNGSSEDALLTFDDQEVDPYLICARKRRPDPLEEVMQSFKAFPSNGAAISKLYAALASRKGMP